MHCNNQSGAAYDCDYVGKNAEDRCSLKDDYKVKSKDACPLSCGECEVEASCADSTSWYYKKSKNDCDYVAKKPEDRCSLKDDSKVKSKDACPLSCGECEEDVPAPAPTATPEEEDEDEGCADSTSWYWKKSKYDCDYVAKKPEDRCTLKDDYKVKGKDACPSSCGECEVEEEDEDEGCVDSTSWYSKKSKYDCDYVAKKPEDRCSLKDDDKVKGKDACPSSCGECEEDVPVPAPVPAPTAAPEDEDEDEDASCADSTSWYWKKSKYDCDYVAKKPEDRCSLKDDYKVKSKDACPSSCGECEEAETCVDSTSWYYKKSKNSCEDYVSKKAKNCAKKDEFKVKAEEACPMTCGAC